MPFYLATLFAENNQVLRKQRLLQNVITLVHKVIASGKWKTRKLQAGYL